MSKWKKLQSLPLRDRLKLVWYSFLLLLIHLGLQGFGYLKVYTFLANHPERRDLRTGGAENALAEARHCASLVSIAARYGFIRVTCLRQALLVFWLLRHQGIQTQLRVGVRRQGESIIAHAWVKYGEDVISEGSQVEKNFTAFEGMPNE
jgi:hypothetical protein